MLDALKSLFETNAISEEIKNDIEEAWNAKVKENQMQIILPSITFFYESGVPGAVYVVYCLFP